MATELKPCPFCGYHAVFSMYIARKGFREEKKKE